MPIQVWSDNNGNLFLSTKRHIDRYKNIMSGAPIRTSLQVCYVCRHQERVAEMLFFNKQGWTDCQNMVGIVDMIDLTSFSLSWKMGVLLFW